MLYSGNTYRIYPDMIFSINYLTLFVVVGGSNEVEVEGWAASAVDVDSPTLGLEVVGASFGFCFVVGRAKKSRSVNCNFAKRGSAWKTLAVCGFVAELLWSTLSLLSWNESTKVWNISILPRFSKITRNILTRGMLVQLWHIYTADYIYHLNSEFANVCRQNLF